MILLDTHILVWLALDPDRLSRSAVLAIRNARAYGGLAISDLSLFELAHLIARKRIQITGSMEQFLHEVEVRFAVKHVTARIAALAMQLSEAYPRDPMVFGVNYSSRSTTTISPDQRQLQAFAKLISPLSWCWPEQRVDI